MECTNFFRTFLLIFITGYHGISAVELSVDFNDQHEVQAGTDVTFTCRAVVPAEEDPTQVTLRIAKVAKDKEQLMFGGTVLIGIYQNLERYTGRKDIEKQVVIVEININGVQEEDSGEYKCVDVAEEGNVASASLMVFSDIDEVNFLHVVPIQSTSPDEVFNVTCYVTSSIPEAVAHIYVDDHDYTDQFHKSTIGQLKNNPDDQPRPTQPVYIDYDTVYRSATFKPLPEHDGKALTCEAHVLGNEGLFLNHTDTFQLEILYPPEFFDCDEEQHAQLHDERARISCSVRYNPVGSSNWTFAWGGSGNQVTLRPDESTTDGEITAGQLRQIEGSNVHKVFLEINKVYERHFQKYTLTASNKFDTTTVDITLKEGEPDGSSSLIASALITVTAAFFARFLWL